MAKDPENSNIRYTTVLPAAYIRELKELSQEYVIPSVNQGIRDAVEAYLSAQKTLRYEMQMQMAAKDKAFMERLLSAQEDFRAVDEEGMLPW